MDAYEKKVARAIRLLKSIPQDGEIEVSYSGGKDSDVILELAKMSGIPFRAIYKNTTIDPPGTIKHCREKGVEIFQPKKSFMQIIEKKGMPTRRARFCCSELKEYKVLDRAIQGIRKTESKAREERYFM
jgi:phosphoadenosine phosphosulfate reductase